MAGLRRPLLAAGALLAILAAAGIGLRLATPSAPQPGPNVIADPTDRPVSIISANNSPAVARNPARPADVVIAHRIDRPAFSSALEWSDDDGASWRQTALPLPAGKDRPFAPDIAFGPDGTLYAVYANLTGIGNAPENLWVSRSTDGGRSLERPVHLAGAESYQARIAVDERGTVYVTWLAARGVGLYKITEPSPIVAARSTDGGRSFQPPVPLSDPGRRLVGAATPAVDSAGNLAVLYEDFRDDHRDVEDLDGPPWDQPFALVLTRSDDGGRTFGRGVEVDSDVVPAQRFLVFLPAFPSLASGPEGRLYAAWSDDRNGDEDVFVRASVDGGRTWGPPRRVNDDPLRNGRSQSLPRVDVAPDGRVDVLFLDRRNDRRDVRAEAYLATSADGGATFRDTRISDRAFDTGVGPLVNPHLPADLGSRLGLDSRDGEVLAAWTDTREGTLDNGRQDIVAARVDIPRLPLPARGRVIAALLVLAAAAIAAGWVAGRRRPPRAIEGGPAAPGGERAGGSERAGESRIGENGPPMGGSRRR